MLIVVDQLPVRLLDAATPLFEAGLARLVGDGAFRGVVRHPHATTFTCPGHATISTGAMPATSGIVSNNWYRPGEPEGTDVYCADMALLRADTLADRVVAAGGQVASVSLKDRGAILLGGRSPGLVSFYDRKNMRFTAPLDDLAIEAWMEAPWTALHPEAYAEVAGVDDNPLEGDAGYGTTFPHPAASTAPRGFLASPYAGEALTDAAIAAVDRLDLGSDAVPDLLTLSYSQTDYIGHVHTAESWEAVDGMVRLDRAIGRLLDHLDAAVGADGYAVALTSDHGAIPAEGATRIAPAAVPDAANAALREAGFEGSVYFEDPGLWLPVPIRSDPEARTRAARAVAAAVRQVPGIGGAWAWREDEIDHPNADAIRASLDDERSGDVYLILAEGGLFDYPGSEGTGTSHGTPFDYDARVPLLAAGAGIEAGRPGTDYDTRQIAPTLAALMAVDPPEDAELGPIDAVLKGTAAPSAEGEERPEPE